MTILSLNGICVIIHSLVCSNYLLLATGCYILNMVDSHIIFLFFMSSFLFPIIVACVYLIGLLFIVSSKDKSAFKGWTALAVSVYIFGVLMQIFISGADRLFLGIIFILLVIIWILLSKIPESSISSEDKY